MYYDRQGAPMELEEWASKHADISYKAVQQEYVDGFFVSTVWLGLDHGFTPGGPPVIFETMIFGETPGSFDEEYQERYSTEDAARAGHDRALAWLRDRLASDRSGAPQLTSGEENPALCLVNAISGHFRWK